VIDLAFDQSSIWNLQS